MVVYSICVYAFTPPTRNAQPHILCWNATLLACSHAGDADGCLALLGRMRARGQEPGAINYARTLSALGRAGRVEEAFALLAAVKGRERGKGLLDRAAYGALIQACGAHAAAAGGTGTAAAAAAESGKAVHAVLGEMRRAGVRPDALTIAQAVAALARGCGLLEEAEALLLGGGAAAAEEEEDGGPAAAPSLLAYHSLMLAAIERQEHGHAQADAAAPRCEALLASLLDRHGLCPTPATHALLLRAGCGPRALAAARGLMLSGAGGEEETAATVSFEAARQGVERALAVNPHDERRRTLHRFLGQV